MLKLGKYMCYNLCTTLRRIPKVGFDRRIIKPIIQIAKNMSGEINNENINEILGNQNLITSMMTKYCR